MYGLDKNADLEFLLNKELEQVAVGMHQIQFHFISEVSISLTSSFQINGQPIVKETDFKKSSGVLLNLLGQAIKKIENRGDGHLELFFSEGDVLKIFEDNENYECYEISGPDGQGFIV